MENCFALPATLKPAYSIAKSGEGINDLYLCPGKDRDRVWIKWSFARERPGRAVES